MRKYIIKKKNSKGFTLVELLAVIVIVAVILLIFVPNITKLVSDFQNKDKIEMLQKSAISAAKDYVSDNYNDLHIPSCTTGPAEKEIDIFLKGEDYSIKYLISENYLDNDDYYKDEHKVVVTYDCIKRKFTKYEYKEN